MKRLIVILTRFLRAADTSWMIAASMFVFCNCKNLITTNLHRFTVISVFLTSRKDGKSFGVAKEFGDWEKQVHSNPVPAMETLAVCGDATHHTWRRPSEPPLCCMAKWHGKRTRPKQYHNINLKK